MNESEFIAALRTLPLHPGAQDLRDDTAILAIGGETLVLTHDAIAEGVHYRPGTDPFDVAWKLVATNLSDLAAKGAEPVGLLVGAVLVDGAERFVEGLRAILTEYDVPLLGGDTISVSPATFGCTAIGRATVTPVPRRDGARPGDGLWITGPVGAAMLGFETGQGSAYLRPRPRLTDGQALAGHVTAMMDVSDGLLLDASRMAEASGCTADITLAKVPVAAGADPLRAVTWGDDYELLFAAPDGFEPPVPAARIGGMIAAGKAPLLLDGQVPGIALGYQHR
ncbi:thiamine-monophosphate kinase [Sphingomonas kyeonggiensis]|uniref:Thiamine-monophosphate kinase n=1 Tax=Sphingomonas kyeonggiensis TaxID=1268553 RepID=A0A7W7JXS6_9SPHN|nr:thiamine-phosphate kinase [Sphingomonas kyeonggiensis]MBB4837096.1 thiamine-monophosphate kinase [Sphingomonas kyeonggiensis]